MSIYRKFFALFAVVGALFVSTGCSLTATSTTSYSIFYDEEGRVCRVEEQCTDSIELTTPEGTTLDVTYAGWGVTITNEDGSQVECAPKTPDILEDLLDQLDCLCEEDEDSSGGTGGTSLGGGGAGVTSVGEREAKDVEGGICGDEPEITVETKECSADANFDEDDWECTPIAKPRK